MKFVKDVAKHLPFYRELRLLYLSFSKYGFKRGVLYPYYRFWISAKIRRLGTPFDRPVDTTTYSLHMMCSHRDVDQFIWALMSWYRVVPESPQVYIHDDGTFTARDLSLIQKLFPHAKVIDTDLSTELAMSQWLIDFPVSQSVRRTRVVKSIKLLDPYFVSEAKHVLLLDTDILWFQYPQELFDHIHGDDETPVFWKNRAPEEFVFKDGELLELDLAYCNSGVVYYNKKDFKLELVEEFFQRRDSSQTLRDQPGYAYVLGTHKQVKKLSAEIYHIKGRVQESTVAKHYTGPRREKFWLEGVRLLQEKYSIC